MIFSNIISTFIPEKYRRKVNERYLLIKERSQKSHLKSFQLIPFVHDHQKFGIEGLVPFYPLNNLYLLLNARMNTQEAILLQFILPEIIEKGEKTKVRIFFTNRSTRNGEPIPTMTRLDAVLGALKYISQHFEYLCSEFAQRHGEFPLQLKTLQEEGEAFFREIIPEKELNEISPTMISEVHCDRKRHRVSNKKLFILYSTWIQHNPFLTTPSQSHNFWLGLINGFSMNSSATKYTLLERIPIDPLK